MKKRWFVKSFPWILLAIWTVFNLSFWGFERFFHGMNFVGLFFGAACFICFSSSLFLVTRWKKLEDWIGGLDKVFQYHQFLGKVGFSCLLMHVFIFSLRGTPRGLASFFFNVLPVHHRFSVNLGSYAFLATTLILFITIFKLLPYHIWKKVHQWMSIVFFFSFLHFFLSNKTSGNGVSTAILYFAAFIGLSSAIYRQLLFKLIVKPFQYTVVKVEFINMNVMKITLRPKNRIISFVPGQYAFIHFSEPNFSEEQHPFTLARNDEQTDLFIYVKNRGDYTKALQKALQSNWTAYLEGPYGRLDYRSHEKQIWIAGGIGIALFLSWMHSLNSKHGKNIDIFFCCHKRDDLEILKEFEILKNKITGIQIFQFCSEDGQRLSGAEIVKNCSDFQSRKVFMCGPKKLTSDMRKQLTALSIKNQNIEYEDFNFF